MSLSESLIRLRKREGIIQAKMAEKLGITTAYYGRLEKKGEELSLIQLTKIADILNISLEELLLGESTSKRIDNLKLEKEVLLSNSRAYEIMLNNQFKRTDELMKLFLSFWFGEAKQDIYNHFKEKDFGEGFFISTNKDDSNNSISISDFFDILQKDLPNNLLKTIDLEEIKKIFIGFFNAHKLTFIKLQNGKILVTDQSY